MAKDKAVTKVEEKTSAVALSDDMAALLAQEAGEGLGDVVKDVALPFISMIQGLSPQKNKRDAKYIDGAEEGMMFNTLTQQLYDGEEGAIVIPCYYEKVYNEWVPRSSGGGFVATHKTEREAQENAQPGNDIVDTANYYVLVQNPDTGTFEPAILSMKSTQLKISRRWNSLMSMLKVDVRGQKITPPMHGTLWLLTTVGESNDKGSFFNYKVEYKGLNADPTTYAEAKAFREMITSGIARPAYNTPGDVVEDEDDDDNPSF